MLINLINPRPCYTLLTPEYAMSRSHYVSMPMLQGHHPVAQTLYNHTHCLVASDRKFWEGPKHKYTLCYLSSGSPDQLTCYNKTCKQLTKYVESCKDQQHMSPPSIQLVTASCIICLCVCMCVCVYVCMCVHACVCVCTYNTYVRTMYICTYYCICLVSI